jgi:hypothetical protein
MSKTLEWTEQEKQESAEVAKSLAEQAEHYKDAPTFIQMLDTLETDSQKLEWCRIAAEDYLARLEKAVAWVFAYRWALAKRFAQDAHPGVEWKNIPLNRRREIHAGLADLLGLDEKEITQELIGHFELMKKYFEPYQDTDSTV